MREVSGNGYASRMRFGPSDTTLMPVVRSSFVLTQRGARPH